MSAAERISENTVVLFMNGSPDLPASGPSAMAAQAVRGCGEWFDHVDVVANPDDGAEVTRKGGCLKIPQLWVAGRLVGGSEAIAEMYENGELQKLIRDAVAQAAARG